ncbi:MAG: DUF5666 domain-containing protein [Candidatus Sulfotelmatobacter sp.]
MGRFLAVAILSSAAFAQSASSAGSMTAQDQGAQRVSVSMLEGGLGGSPGLPTLPSGRSTVIGGAIRGVDHVRDQFTLNVFGGQKFKIVFDARTQVFRNGLKSTLLDLHPGDHVSVETVLDGTTVFARSIHVLSEVPEGECQGQVLNYRPDDGELTVRDVLSHEPFKLHVPAGTSIVGQGQAASSADRGLSALATGTLVSVKFQSDNKGHGVASLIVILATPGTAFVFVGNVAFLDLHLGQLVLVDPRDGKRYEVSFDSARFPMSRELHEGADVTVTADFDGARYVASAIAINAPSDK